MKKNFKYREIPYNYTSFSDKEIILKYFDEKTWDILNELRNQRVTGRSAKLLFEVLGDIFIIDRNPYIFNDFLENPRKQRKLKKIHKTRLDAIQQGAGDNKTVLEIIAKAKEADKVFFASFKNSKKNRKRLQHILHSATARENICFTAFHKVTHVTDATDWRVEYPEVVVYPENIKEIQKIIPAAKKAGLKIIPRGGGTGLTGGAIPVYKNTLVLNLEKLRTIHEIEVIKDNTIEIPVIEVDAGVITEEAENYCAAKGYIFATDPTSAWASTIGGNIAENCGGKKAVIWGTAIDNIYSFRMINHEGKLIEIKRQNHPYRKILPEDSVSFDVYEISKKNQQHLRTITLTGTEIRKKGVGKDITNKALKGLPGLQKEGGDGIIVSAKFVLYKPFTFQRTLCLEFYGNNMLYASKAIVDILDSFKKNDISYLTALEHFDEKYVIAIDYKNKSERDEIPKAILLIDVESNNEGNLDKSCQEVIDLVKQYNTEGFIAKDEQAQLHFWKDRKNLGAIAKHTNAFKLNEDVVIPIESLPAFADFIEKLNIEKELKNNIETIEEIKSFLDAVINDTEIYDNDTFFPTKLSSFNSKMQTTLERYNELLSNIDLKGKDFPFIPSIQSEDRTIFELIREKVISINLYDILIQNFKQSFHGYIEIIQKFEFVVSNRQNKKIIIATHMHAGDGNIHVNIPVHSNDYAMLMEADETAGIIMEKTKELGGVISGEHGIGLTKLKFIDKKFLDDYADYKKEHDPDDLFNPGKLKPDFPSSSIYTPSLNLLEMEAFILEATDLINLTTSISGCVRCGKCKEVCNTHYPQESIFYSPRNKILGVSLITEAVLYEAQTENTLGIRNFKMLREISNYCTGCHNCLKPCPVKIDFGDVTLDIRKLLLDRGKSKFKAVTTMTLFYLRRRGYYINKLFRIALLNFGYTGQRMGHYLHKPFAAITKKIVPYINAMLSSKLPKAGQKSIREILKLKTNNALCAFENQNKKVLSSVVYFPGCGSERMFPEISMAVIALLYNAGVRVVIPPEYLCCGYPLLSNGRTRQAETKSSENRIIFHRMAGLLAYMDIAHIIISCGTCYEMISKYEVENIFQDATIIDINEFIAKHNLYDKNDARSAMTYLYHDPCHTPLKQIGATKTFEQLLGAQPVIIGNCCGEGGTLALSTPDISNSLRERKKTNIFTAFTESDKATVLTTCPSCVQGLSRIQGKHSVNGKALAVFLAETYLGKNWKKQFIKDIKKGGFERIIL